MAAVDSSQAQVEVPAPLPGSQPNSPQPTEDLTEDVAEKSRSVVPYLLENSPEFRELSDVRQRGWEAPEGDKYFANLRQNADKSDEKTVAYFHKFMNTIGHEIDKATNAFKISPVDSTPSTILDICMAPGAFLEIALKKNPGSHALAFSLPVSCGGYKSRLASSLNVKRVFLDVTMLAVDMDVDQIPEGHEDAENFLPRQLEEGRLFDLVICDGQVLRQHPRAPYREKREATRLATTQLALGLQHLRPGGTIIVLLHRLEAWNTANLVWMFHKISSVQLFKPKKGHVKRSSFYMVATNVEIQHPEAVEAVKRWKESWRIATFGSDEEYGKMALDKDPSVEKLVEDFGPELMKLGKAIWKRQANALAKAPFMKNPE
ncbi:Ribosomal RNA methyltransferase RrmJ/FtsJ [Penicillium camemberti]|uniref:Ribosomal RNA methyltransferase RrmJ/FtsJ n=1 Tax=Penicillium camemberti (strain FM 013) TaxID=1429867 RepID=A0A0G4PIU3_PENC3|nr:Ribosomal RNA methyltransferase RrmJ/FtsJ [Penicillium camemberti]